MVCGTQQPFAHHSLVLDKLLVPLQVETITAPRYCCSHRRDFDATVRIQFVLLGGEAQSAQHATEYESRKTVLSRMVLGRKEAVACKDCRREEEHRELGQSALRGD